MNTGKHVVTPEILETAAIYKKAWNEAIDGCCKVVEMQMALAPDYQQRLVNAMRRLRDESHEIPLA